MAIDFPASPTTGQTFTSGSVTYTWDGVKWTAVAAGGGATDKITEGNTSAEVIDTGSDGRFVVTTEGTEALRVDSSQRVGIGTTTVNTTLEVVNSSAPIIRVGDGTRHVQLWGGSSTQNQAVGTATAASFGFNINSSEVARFDSSGRLLVGTSSTSSSALLQVQGNSSSSTGDAIIQLRVGKNNVDILNGNSLGSIQFSNAQSTVSAVIEAIADANWNTTNDYPSRLVFSTTADGASSPTSRMVILNNGGITFDGSTTTTSAASGRQTFLTNEGIFFAAADGLYPGVFNRNGNDGDIIQLRQANVTEGTISVSGTTVSYNGAHLSRWSQLPSGAERTEILRGTILSNIDEMCEWGDEDNEQLNRMKVSDVEGDKNVSGVFQAWDDDDDTYTNDFYCAMTGDFIIRIGAGVTVERGDLLMSAGDGTAKPQDDDIIRSKTIAKVTSTNVSCTYPDGSYCVPCVLMAC